MTKKILSITINKLYDEDPDTSTLGEYTDRPEPYAIIRRGEHEGKFVQDLRASDELPQLGREYNYFLAYAGGETPGTKTYRKYAKQDYKRMEDYERQVWNFIGIRAEAEIVTGEEGPVQKITSGGLWGVESDSGKSYLRSVAKDEISSLETELLSLGFSAVEIKQATKQAIRDIG